MQRRFITSLIFLLLLNLFAVVQAGFSAEPLARRAEDILQRVVEQAEKDETRAMERGYGYRRNTMVIHYDENGKLKRQVDKVYEVAPEHGEVVMTLVSVNGKPVEPEVEETRGSYSQAGDDAKQIDFDEDLIARYDFKYEGDEVVNGRTMAVLTFKPKSEPLDDGGIFAKLLNQLAGTLWVDLEDEQVARLEVKLLRRVSFFAGIAGALDRMELQMVRVRVAPGVWLNGSTRIELRGRKLFSAVRFQAFENCTEFEKVREVEPVVAR